MNTQIEFDEDNNFFGDEERSYVKNHILRCNCDNRTHVIVEKLIEKEHELQRLKQEIELSIEQAKIQAEFFSIKKAGGMTELIKLLKEYNLWR
jgi:spore maturation protein CgeB